jgi:hypothetical protein
MAKAPDTDGLLLKIQEWVRADMDAPGYRKWRARAKENFPFVTPWGQWTDEERSYLENQKRPVVAFNKTSKFIRALCGIEVNNRLQTTYIPREPDNAGEVKANELLTDASIWMDETSDAARHQSRAFRDANICGVGVTESTLSYDDDPEGLYKEERIYPLEMGWDKDARDQNLQDAKRLWRVREMSIKEARDLLPGITDDPNLLDEDLDARWAADISSPTDQDAKTQKQKERRDARGTTGDEDKAKVHIVQIQWWEHETYIRAPNPKYQATVPGLPQSSEPKHVDLHPDQFKMLADQHMATTGMELPHAKLRRRVFKQAFVGGKVLEVKDAPRRDGFTFNFMTAEPDDKDGSFYGVVDLLKDPQRWVNKFFSQIMHMVNSSAKGGILAEEDAFADAREAQEGYARSDAITITTKGAIQKGKIMPKPGTAVTSGVAALYQMAEAAFPDVTGMSLELMGLADREQAGVLEAQRKHAAMTILATIFDARSLFKKQVGRTKLYFIQEHLSNDRWIRIDSTDGPKAKQLTSADVGGKYDTIVGDAPSAPDTKERAWQALQPVLPFFMEQGAMTPELASEIIDFIPGLPSKLTEAFKKAISEPKPGAEEQAQIAARGAQAQIAKDEGAAAQSKTAAVLNLAKATKERQMTSEQEALNRLREGFEKLAPAWQAPEDAEIIGPDQNTMDFGRMMQQPEPLPAEPDPLGGGGGFVPPGGLNGNGGY